MSGASPAPGIIFVGVLLPLLLAKIFKLGGSRDEPQLGPTAGNLCRYCPASIFMRAFTVLLAPPRISPRFQRNERYSEYGTNCWAMLPSALRTLLFSGTGAQLLSSLLANTPAGHSVSGTYTIPD